MYYHGERKNAERAGISEEKCEKGAKNFKKILAKEVDLVVYFVRKIKERGLISEMITILNDVDDLIFRDEEWICSDR